jgi:putative thioredoxin
MSLIQPAGAPANGMGADETQWILDIDESNFVEKAYQKSNEIPVVLDLWSERSEACKVLTPVLEEFARKAAGKFILAKINVDQNQNLAMQLGIKSIPSVKALVNGQIAAEFTGAVPKDQIRKFLSSFVQLDDEDKLEAIEELLAANDFENARQQINLLIQAEPENMKFHLLAAQCLIAEKKLDEAKSLLSHIGADKPEYSKAQAMLQRLVWIEQTSQWQECETILVEAKAPEANAEILYKAGLIMAAQGQFEASLPYLLKSLQKDLNFNECASKLALVTLFELLGHTLPIVRQTRKTMSMLLF